jgi:hypothetical protein
LLGRHCAVFLDLDPNLGAHGEINICFLEPSRDLAREIAQRWPEIVVIHGGLSLQHDTLDTEAEDDHIRT